MLSYADFLKNKKSTDDIILCPTSGKNSVPLTIKDEWFTSPDKKAWEKLYDQVLCDKYKKNTRSYSKILPDKTFENPPIFLIPRERGGPSFYDVELNGYNSDDLFYGMISKGYGMQNISSFSLGPVIGEGLCVVNSAFSKAIHVMHLEGGQVDLKRKNYQPS